MKYAYSKELIGKIKDYYTGLYSQVGLKNIEEMVSWRLREEEEDAKRISKVEYVLNMSVGNGQKCLIVGTGTGGLAVELYKKGCKVYGLEPNESANQIVRLKAEAVGMPKENFTTDKAESIPFHDSSFDLIFCFSVIEHVDDVKKSLNEMIRVLKPDGYIYLSTNNYSFPYERHYKIAFPTFLPKIFGYAYLLLKKRPLKFYRHIKLVNKCNIYKILFESKYPVIWQRFNEQYSYLKDKRNYLRYLFWRFFTLNLGVQMNIELFIRRLPKNN